MILVPRFYMIFSLGRRLHVLLTSQVTFKSKGSEQVQQVNLPNSYFSECSGAQGETNWTQFQHRHWLDS